MNVTPNTHDFDELLAGYRRLENECERLQVELSAVRVPLEAFRSRYHPLGPPSDGLRRIYTEACFVLDRVSDPRGHTARDVLARGKARTTQRGLGCYLPGHRQGQEGIGP